MRRPHIVRFGVRGIRALGSRAWESSIPLTLLRVGRPRECTNVGPDAGGAVGRVGKSRGANDSLECRRLDDVVRTDLGQIEESLAPARL